MESLGLRCGWPMAFVAIGLLMDLWPKGERRTTVVCATILATLVGLAVLDTVRHVVLEEGLVMDACSGDATGVRGRIEHGADPNAKDDIGWERLGARRPTDTSTWRGSCWSMARAPTQSPSWIPTHPGRRPRVNGRRQAKTQS